MSQISRFRALALAGALLLLAPGGRTATAPGDDLTELSLEDLLGVVVTSVSKRSQSVQDAPAAVFVMSREDIERSGARTLPDLLRMVPGLYVASIDANKWSVGSRGFAGRYAAKLLVLIDGRSVYSPFFSGVYWDVQDTTLFDIERIEVIRGPGATLWGANAVNGVINVITREAGETEGLRVAAGAGNEERGFVEFRHGASLSGGRTSYRVFGKYFDRDGSIEEIDGAEGRDGWRAGRVGVRSDTRFAQGDSLTIQAGVHKGDVGESIRRVDLETVQEIREDEDQDVSGVYGLARWARNRPEGGSYRLQAYVDREQRTSLLFEDRRTTVDVEFQDHRVFQRERRRHDLTWGIGLRRSADRVNSSPNVSFPDRTDSQVLANLFAQNDLRLTEKAQLTVGTKIEHNDYTGFEVQPNIRLRRSLGSAGNVWGSVARAVRTPSRAEVGSSTIGLTGIIPPGSPGNPFPVPMVTDVEGRTGFDSEKLLAYEAGWKFARERFQFDLSAFYNDYRDLRTAVPGEPTCEPGGEPVSAIPPCFAGADYIRLPFGLVSSARGATRGFEWASDWRPSSWMRLQAAYSFLEYVPLGGGSSLGAEGAVPKNLASLRATLDPGGPWSGTLWARYRDRAPRGIDSFLTLDTRWSYRVSKNVDLSVVGRNLLDRMQVEAYPELTDAIRSEIERSYYVQIDLRFP